MSRQTSIPDRESESIPPPSGNSVEERLQWCLDVLRGPMRRIPARVARLEENVGQEGNHAKGRPATGLHLAMETVLTKLDEIGDAIGALGKARATREEWATWGTRAFLAAIIVGIVAGGFTLASRVRLVPADPPAAAAAPPR